jgi:membrane-bound serine protease (ClpP class)
MALKPVHALLAGLMLVIAGWASAQGAPAGQPKIYIADLDGVIGPASAHIVQSAIARTERDGGEALILRMNTPGGLSTSMREIIQAILAARVPVIGYVSPSGGHAASAGTFILYATHVAAMAPGTNIGAASPVSIGGSPLTPQGEAPDQSVESAKAMNDAVALIRGLAALRGRNADWAEAAVRNAAALTADEALARHVIEIEADDLPALLDQLDGRAVEVAGAAQTLHTAGARLETLHPSFVTSVLALLANPNVALILMMIGVYGLIYEFLTPGSFGPGIAGAICLILGLYALNQLPLNYAGLALIAVGVGLMIAEAFTPTFGILGFGGVLSFAIGAAMLIDTDIPAFQISPWLIAFLTVATGAVIAAIATLALRAVRAKRASNVDHITQETGEVLDWAGRSGHVWAQGERWRAIGETDLQPGQIVNIVGRDSLRLRVAPQTGATE